MRPRAERTRHVALLFLSSILVIHLMLSALCRTNLSCLFWCRVKIYGKQICTLAPSRSGTQARIRAVTCSDWGISLIHGLGGDAVYSIEATLHYTRRIGCYSKRFVAAKSTRLGDPMFG
ncbi:hypothetical protein F5B19DRAFT_473291 [Rostrohypoxylon terebratum]|nr:hypothetical protein F5B19DRAFT_473291 [Rostrohypoxylon terebratum]